jgi:predicted AlkP superfamily pyrophosphatase or phosphodiesterase
VSRRLSLAAGVGLAALAALPVDARAERPRLVLLLAVDQLRRDRLDPTLPGGLGRLRREGRVFADAALQHAATETCPGHVTMLTGRHPGPAGVPGNRFVDRQSGESRYCVGDPAEDARTLGGSEGRSPRRLRVSALGDWLKASDPESRVFSVSPKDRAAIVLGGQRPDAAYWLDRKQALGFTTSAYYRSELPAWVGEFTGADPARDGFLAEIPERWEHATGGPANTARRDAYPAEVAQYGRVSGHRVRSADLAAFLDQLYRTPFLDDVTLDFARALIENESLGRDAHTDLLAISLAATDTVGHLYGPASQEARDALLRLDAAVGSFLAFLDETIGRDHVLVVLTADHGVLPVPEWLLETGSGTCPLKTGRVDVKAVLESLESALHQAFSPDAAREPWLAWASFQFTVRRARAEQQGVPVEAVIEVARRALASQPAVARVWTAPEMAAGDGPVAFAALYRNSYDPARSGDFAVQPVRDCLFGSSSEGTSHGSPYLYDRAVPIVFVGPGIEAGVVRGRAATVDMAPTLASELDLAAPDALDGRVLRLRP